MDEGLKRTDVRLLLASGESATAIAERTGLPPNVVDRIAATSGLGRDGWRVLHPDAAFKPSREAQTVLDDIGWPIEERVPDRPRCSRRDAALCESLILEDITLDEAGKPAHITRERTRQILLKHTGLSVQVLERYRNEVREAHRLASGKAIVFELLQGEPVMTVSALAAESGLRIEEVEGLIGTAEALRRRRRYKWQPGVKDEELLAELRRVSGLPGGSPLTARFYDSHRSGGAVTAVRVMQRFSTWSAACEAAGLASRGPRRKYESAWTDEDLLGWVRKYVTQAGTRPSFAGLDVWLRERKEEGAPSSGIVRRLGRWGQVLSMALDEEPSGDPQGDLEAGFLGLPPSRWTEEETDSDALTKARREQSYLRHHLLRDRKAAACDFCNTSLPARLLVAAHIYPRKFLTNTERRRFWEIAVLSCPACDAFFEWGYLVVTSSGKIETGKPAETGDLRERVAEIAGGLCSAFTPDNAPAFRRHRLLHLPAE